MFITAGSWAQSNIRYQTYSLKADTLLLDSLSIVPGTIAIRNTHGELVDTNTYTLRAFESQLIWKNKPPADSVKIFFRVYPFALARPTYNKSYSDYLAANANSLARPFVYSPDAIGSKLIDFGNLDYNGVFARGIAFGSNQSVVLNSVFNLQVSGYITKDLELTAAVTDNSIPIQPEGNTQQIQEFDKIFIQLKQGHHQLIVGDFDLFNPEPDYFMRFSKKYQGGYYRTLLDFKKKGALKLGAAGGISRGKFSRNTLAVSEGNQGPYKLQGANGETYIIILANTEEVFVNGQKLERGADRDYVIDYNLGEITFMPRKIITKDLRVLIEFEYSERNYLRSTAFLNTEYQSKIANLHFNLYSEQDSKGQNVQQSLNADKKYFLTTIGDSLNQALYHGWDSVAFDAHRIMYRLIPDSLGFDSVFVYSIDTAVAKYTVNFSQVPFGKGDYIAASSTANGRVYQWVAPIIDSTGKIYRQGNYVPLILLVTPKYQQLYTVGTDIRINNTNTVSVEAALSNTDVNMYSKKNDNDNLGVAVRASLKGTVMTKNDSTQKQTQNFVYDFNYEFLQNRFNTIERYRNIEFNRDWNITAQPLRYNEHLVTANFTYLWNNIGNINYRFKTLIQDSVYRGFENSFNGAVSKNGSNFSFTNSYLHAKTTQQTTHFFRPRAEYFYTSQKTKGWKIGAFSGYGLNMTQNKTADTLNPVSSLWQNHRIYVANADTAVNRYTFEFAMRYEHHAQGNSFGRAHFSGQTINFTGQINSLKNQTLNYSLTYRHAKERDSVSTSQPEHFYLGRIDYNFVLLKGVFRSTTLYEVGSGRQQKIQLTYQRSPVNQGEFAWLGDLNENGIQDVNEFRASNITDTATYLRMFITTPEFISVNTTQFNQVLNINPAAVWKNKKGIRKVISMFSIFTSVSVTKKTFADKRKNAGEYFNPFPLVKQDSFLVATTMSSRNSLFFNRLDPKYGAQIDFNYSRNRTLLTTGFENRILQSQGIIVRWNVFKQFNAQAAYTNGLKANESDYYNHLQYRFTYNDAQLDVSYQFKTFLRISTKYDFSHKLNPTDTVGNQTAQVHKGTFNLRYNRQEKNTIDATLEYSRIAYNDKGLKNEQLEYAMLEGLRNGNNLVWSVGYAQSLGNNIQLTLSYDGRMTGFSANDKSTLKPVHTGRAELRAVF